MKTARSSFHKSDGLFFFNVLSSCSFIRLPKNWDSKYVQIVFLNRTQFISPHQNNINIGHPIVSVTHLFISLFAQLIFLFLGQIPQGHIKKVVESWSRFWYGVTVFIVTFFIFFFVWNLRDELKCRTWNTNIQGPWLFFFFYLWPLEMQENRFYIF